MTVSAALHELTEWLNANVCPKLRLKLQKSPMTAAYDYELVHPTAWLMFEPPSDPNRPPSMIPKTPSILVQLVNGTDDSIHKQQRLNIRLHLCVWNPGTHGMDMFLYLGDGKYRQADDKTFMTSMDGMEDCFNLLDTTLHELKKTINIGKLHVAQEDGINFGHYESAEAGISSYYPYYLMWIEFSLVVGQAPTRHNTIDGFL